MPPFCSILAARLPQTATDWYVFLGIAAFVIACMTGSALWHRNRRKKLQSAMELLGLALVLPGEPECGYIHAPQKGQKSFQVRLCGVGALGRRAVRAVEYTFETGSGKSRKTHYNLQVSFDCPVNWPSIWLGEQPDVMHRPISQLFGGGGNAATPDAAFNKRWTVSCENHAMPATLLTADIRDLLMQGPKTERWAIAEGWVTCTWRKAGTMKDLRQIAERSRQMLELAERALAEWRSA